MQDSPEGTIKKTLGKAQRLVLRGYHGLVWQSEGNRDWARLSKVYPGLCDYSTLTASDRVELEPAYEWYTTNVSTKRMSISFQTSLFTCAMSRILRPKRFLDLGSGFSSYVMRYCAKESDDPVEVCSVDDNDYWLVQTETFLKRYDMHGGQLLPWSRFQDLDIEPFDLILHDMGKMTVRKAALPRILDLLAPGGILIFDDMHKQHYRDDVIPMVKRRGFELYSARNRTLDSIRRFSEIAVRHPAKLIAPGATLWHSTPH